MPALAAMALASFAFALGRTGPVSPTTLHLVLAAGILPLIFGAMVYFTPVLTRSLPAPPTVRLIPLAAVAAGLLASGGLLGLADGLTAGAVLALVADLALLVWMLGRARRSLGGPNPCLYWYLWALACLALGLVSILAGLLEPRLWVTARRLHLHLNTLGFVGLTAFGTLRVLLPTAGGYTDPQALPALSRDLRYAVLGTLLAAGGAAWAPPLALLGAALWLVPVARLARVLLGRYRHHVWGWHGPATALGVAVLGWGGVVLSGVLHGARWQPGAVTEDLLLLTFLLPLVTGAVSYLLPVWVHPGRQDPRFQETARRLSRASTPRVMAFVAAGVLTAAGVSGAGWLALAALAGFAVQAAWALRA